MEQLKRRLAHGETEAFVELYDLLGDQLLRYLTARLNRFDARDVLLASQARDVGVGVGQVAPHGLYLAGRLQLLLGSGQQRLSPCAQDFVLRAVPSRRRPGWSGSDRTQGT